MDTRSAAGNAFVHSPSCGASVDPLTRALAILTLAGVVVIAVIALAVQFLRRDLDWFTVSLSVYAIGRFGDWMRAAFLAPAPGIAALGIGWYRTLDKHARNLAPLGLFIASAIALCMLAAFTTDTTPWPVTLHGQIHQWAAFSTFVCLTTAALVQSALLRLDPRWRRHFIEGTVIAGVCVVYFWVFALAPLPRGLGEKVVIALVLLWLWRAAWWLATAPLQPKPAVDAAS